MRCPSDVDRRLFNEMLDSVPADSTLRSSKRWRWWREFTFIITGNPSKTSGFKRGDEFILSCPLKIRGL